MRKAARKIGCGVVGTGKIDYASDGERLFSIANGHPLMTRVTGMGCVATSIVAAFLAVQPIPLVGCGSRDGVYRYCRGVGGGACANRRSRHIPGEVPGQLRQAGRQISGDKRESEARDLPVSQVEA